MDTTGRGVNPSNGKVAGEAAGLDAVVARVLEFVRSGMIVGLGSGRAASAFIRGLAERMQAGLGGVRGVPTSGPTARLARDLGIPLVDLDEGPVDLTVDGADEVDPKLNLIKGYGGALVRERIVAAASRRQVILVGPEKLVPVLGSRGRLPVEVIPFALPLCRHRLEGLACRPTLRMLEGQPFFSDNGHWILDCAIVPSADPAALDGKIRAIPGVVDTGFFLGTADMVLVAEADGVRVLRRDRV